MNNLKNYITGEVVLIPTYLSDNDIEKESLMLWKGHGIKDLYWTKKHFNDNGCWDSYELIIISNEAIQDNDWVYDKKTKNVSIAINSDYLNATNYHYKVLATTDQTFTYLLKIQYSFIEKFIESYNENNTIKEVLIMLDKYDGTTSISNNWNDKIKTNELNEISIKVIQSPDEEMYLNMQYYMEHCIRYGYCTPQEYLEKYK